MRNPEYNSNFMKRIIFIFADSDSNRWSLEDSKRDVALGFICLPFGNNVRKIREKRQTVVLHVALQLVYVQPKLSLGL